MMRLIPDDNVMVTTGDHDLISHEKVLVKMDAGCVWVYLLENGVRVGAAFAGPSRFVVDAIAETKLGAMGESISGSLEGIQLYIGVVPLEVISKSADDSSLQERGFHDRKSFLAETESTVKDQLNGDQKQVKMDQKEKSQILFGRDSEKVKLILILNQKKGLVFTRGKQVFVLDDDNMVSVSKSGVAITDKHGKHIVVGKGGIHGIDNFVDIGPIVTESVTNAMKSLKGLKSLKSMKQSMKGFPYDNVDDFDWDD